MSLSQLKNNNNKTFKKNTKERKGKKEVKEKRNLKSLAPSYYK